MIASATTRSLNEKLGNAATTYVAQVSCPTTCAFKDSGCYAETGRVGEFVTARLNQDAYADNASALDAARAEAKAIDSLDVAPGKPLRLHTVGDCASDEAALIVAAAAERYMERGGGPVWTYTHAWDSVQRQSWGTVSVLASCETPEQVERARARGYATAVVVKAFHSEGLHDGILPCPAQTRAKTCSSCRLCFNDSRLRQAGYSIGFEIHGIALAKRLARLALDGDPLRRVPSEERIRSIRQRYLSEQYREPTVAEVGEEIDLNESSIYEWLRYLRGEIMHPAERRRRVRERQRRERAASHRNRRAA